MTSQPEISYEAFLRAKMPVARSLGFVPPSDPHKSLKPHQIDLARWMAHGGRRACFAKFGLGKTRIHLQVAKWVTEQSGKKYLIVAPLGVRQEFTRNDGPAMGLTVTYCRTDDEVRAATTPIVITNYERVRDGQITVDPEVFAGAGLDESSVLRSYGSKTYQTFLRLFARIQYRYVFTATPSPNRHKELIHYGGFLGIMDTGEALTRFFQRNSEKAGDLTLYPHMEEIFWMWLSSWAAFVQRPSDLGYPDDGYDLPPLKVHWHCLPADHTKAWGQADSWGQAQLFLDQSSGLAELAGVKRDTAVARIEYAKQLMAVSRFKAPPPPDLPDMVIDEAFHLVENQSVLRRLLDGESWGDSFGVAGRSTPDGLSWDGNAKGIKHDGKLIKPPRILQRAKQYTARHWLLWHDLEAERRLIERVIPDVRTAYGSQDLEEREEIILGFGRGEFPILATKPIIAGSGTNLQRHCSDAIFLGSTYKFNDFIQAVHRIYRFQQGHEVNVHVIYTESESPVVETLKRKWAQHDLLVARMSEIIREHKLSINHDMKLHRQMGVGRAEAEGKHYRAILNDCIMELRTVEQHEQPPGYDAWPDNCVDQIVTSIPFGNQYEYSPNFADLGHNPDNEAFFQQMEYLVPNLLRVLRPGRLACIHVKDRIRFGSVTGLGFPKVDRFSDKTADLFERHGFECCGRITVDTDVVRENNQTYRLGWTENSKDGTKMGVGMPEYVLLMRKPQSDLSKGYADVPVTKSKEDYTRAHWQIDASHHWRSDGQRLPSPEQLMALPMNIVTKIWREYALTQPYDLNQHRELCLAFEREGRLPGEFMLFPPLSANPDIWNDIARMRVLNMQQGQKGKEHHVCPLQLDIVERLINRYSNRGEIILDPFAGIATVPYMAIKMGRIGWGIELSLDYWKDGVGYCELAENERDVPTLFDLQPVEKAS